LAWLDDPPCDVYNESSLDECRAGGMAIAVAPSSAETVVLTMKARR